jgi:hypothetical protein
MSLIRPCLCRRSKAQELLEGSLGTAICALRARLAIPGSLSVMGGLTFAVFNAVLNIPVAT